MIGKIVTSDDPLFKGEIDGAFYKERLVVGQMYGSSEKAVDITCDRKVTPETDTWWHGFDRGAIESANLILLMVSPDYLASEHCRSLIDLVRLRDQEGLATVVPIMLRPVEWQPPDNWDGLPGSGQAVID